MFDLRIYRTALLPAVAAFVLMMFSFEPAPPPLEPPVTPPVFEGTDATRIARGLLSSHPDLTPGSAGDRATAELVRERFAGIKGGIVAEQPVEVPFEGEDVSSENLILTLPGSSDRTVVLLAARNGPDPGRSVNSAAATAALLEIADDLGDTRHEVTIVLASVAGGGGAAGARALADALQDPVEVVIALEQPADPDPRPPFVIVPSGGAETSTELVETARSIVETRFERADPPPGAWTELAELAFPEGVSIVSALGDEGLQALGISSGGERPEPTTVERLTPATLAASGGSALELVQTLDQADRAPEPSSGARLRFGDNLVPGWSLALFALSLLLAPLLAAIDTWARAMRADWRTRRTVFWALERVLVPLGALLLVLGLSLVGLIPDPAYPLDPGLHHPGSTGVVVLCLIALVAALVTLLIRPMRTPLDSEPHALAAAAGLLSTVGVLGIWALDPFLALLLAPAAHVWVPVARASGPPRPSLVALLALASLLPALAAFLTSAGSLGLDPYEAIWARLLMIADGQVSLLLALCWCLLLGGLLGCPSAASTSGPSPPDRRRMGGIAPAPIRASTRP